MATGIFTTMRACGEAICVAAALSVLNSLMQGQLAGALPGENAARVAAELVTGNFAAAQSSAQPLSPAGLMSLYSQAFKALCYGLAALTLSAALISRWALRDRAPSSTPHAAPRTGR